MKWIRYVSDCIRKLFRKRDVEVIEKDVEPTVEQSISLADALREWKKQNGS